MTSSINRRDFLKLGGLLSLGLAVPAGLRIYGPSQPATGGSKNVLVIVFDALSAYHIPIYGYSRKTTPNLARLAERAIVYHNHFAGGNFTTPGTASLLTGTLPWTNRAFQLNGTVAEAYANKTIFQAFEHYYRIVYSHNPLVNTLFKQFAAGLDDYVPQGRLFLTADSLIDTTFGHDADIADVGWTRAIKKEDEGYSYSLFLADLYKVYIRSRIARVAKYFPRGIPNIRGDNFFLLEDAIDWLKEELGRLPRPYVGYFHFMPPHAPTNTRSDFFGAFAHDGYAPPMKPDNPFSGQQTAPELLRQRTSYDEYILYLDQEFGRLFDFLESTGVLDNTWVVLTSDHGELFERGVRGHVSPLLYQPVVRTPLLVFEPGRKSRLDVTALTSAIDVLPTLLHVTGQAAANWAEGNVLPPFASEPPDPQRVVYSLHAKRNDPVKPLEHATAMLAQGPYKLTYYFGYEELGEGVERVELYDVQADPEELHNLFDERNEVGRDMLAALKQKLKEVNEPYL